MIRRGKEPFKGAWALPGGFLEVGQETLETCAVREAREETGLDVTLKRLVSVRSDPGRDPRGHTVTAVYETEPLPMELAQQAKAASDAAETLWIDPISPEFAALELAFDHEEIIRGILENPVRHSKPRVPE